MDKQTTKEVHNLTESKNGYNLRSRTGKENIVSSARGLALSQAQKPAVGRKSFLSKAQLKATKEIMEGKQNTIGRALRARNAPGGLT